MIGALVATLAASLGAGLAAAALALFLGAAAGIGLQALLRQQRPEPPADDAPADASQPARRETDFQRNDSALRAIHNLPAPLILLDARGRIAIANAAAERELAKPLAQRHFTEALRAPSLVEAVQAALERGEAAEVRFSLHHLQERHLAATVTPLAQDPNGPGRSPVLDSLRDPIQVMILIQDVTRIRRAEQLHRDFVANASHELKTPLAAIAGFIETLRGPAKDDATARARFLVMMGEQAERMRLLLVDLLSLNRIELNEHVPPRDTVDLRRVLASAIEIAPTAEPDAAAPQGWCRLAMPDTLPPVIGDARELEQLFLNLLSNALKYGGGKQPVRVTVTESALPRPRIGVAIRDSGPGVAKEHLPRLTERFYRVDEPLNRGKGGTGLGLAIVKHIVARHRGELEVDSELGRGACFTVWLPVAS